jgi:hypothetical protein
MALHKQRWLLPLCIQAVPTGRQKVYGGCFINASVCQVKAAMLRSGARVLCHGLGCAARSARKILLFKDLLNTFGCTIVSTF